MAELTLTDEQIAHFDREGYLVLRSDEHNLIDPSLLHQWTTEVRSLPREKGKWMPYDEITPSGERQLMRTENFVDYHSGFASVLYSPGLLRILQQLTRKDMLLFKDKINYKLPNANGFGPHLDAPAYDHIGRIEHTTANIAVDPATRANGCLEIVPGSHRMPVALAPDSGGRISDSWVAAHTWLPVELGAGDMLIFGSHFAHRSGPNTTSEPRASVYATYHARADAGEGEDGLRARYYAHRRENFPPDHERIAGKDYGSGIARYAFAAPFALPEHSNVVSHQVT